MARSMGSYNTLVATGSTPAQYADWGLRQSTVIRSVLARTGDTGQVNWAGITAIGGIAVVRDYEVFAFTDALQATKPIYIRIDWSSSGTSAAGQVWVGTTTNGAGTLSGLQLGQSVGAAGTSTLGAGSSYKPFYVSNSGSPSQVRYCYASSDGSYLLFLTSFQQPGQAGNTADSVGGFVVERTRDADGTPNGNGFLLWTWNSTGDSNSPTASSFQGVQLRSYDLSQPNSYAPNTTADYGAALPGNISTATTTVVAGGPAQGFPVYGAAPQPQGASKALMLAYAPDLPRMAPVTLTHYGQPTQWIGCGAAQPVNAPYMTSSTTTAATRNVLSLAFRWE